MFSGKHTEDAMPSRTLTDEERDVVMKRQRSMNPGASVRVAPQTDDEGRAVVTIMSVIEMPPGWKPGDNL
jgi:hypothetical protein